MNRYFATMSAEEDFSCKFEEDVTWLMVDSGQETDHLPTTDELGRRWGACAA
jgi:hypothetical protein